MIFPILFNCLSVIVCLPWVREILGSIPSLLRPKAIQLIFVSFSMKHSALMSKMKNDANVELCNTVHFNYTFSKGNYKLTLSQIWKNSLHAELILLSQYSYCNHWSTSQVCETMYYNLLTILMEKMSRWQGHDMEQI